MAENSPGTSKDDVKTTKRTRTDRTEKRLQRHFESETVVKAKLWSRLLPGNYQNKTRDRQAFMQELEDRVKAVSRRRHLASLSLLLSILRATENVSEDHEFTSFDSTTLSPFLEQSFFRQLMLGVENAQAPNEVVSRLHEEYPELLLTGERYTGDRNLYSSATTAYLTNLKNHLRLNFQAYIKRTVTAFSKARDWNPQEASSIFFSVMGWSSRSLGVWYPQRKEAYDFVSTCRKILGLEGNSQVTEDWLKQTSNHPKIITLYVYLSRRLQGVEGKLFNVVPIAQVRRTFITIDNSVLQGLLSDLRTIGRATIFEGFDIAALTSDDDHFTKECIWRLAFDVESLRGSSKTFSFNVQTDGVSICMHFTQPKASPETENEGQERDWNAYRVLGLDPGRVNIYYIVEVLPDGTYKCYVLSRGRYYLYSGLSRAIKRANKWSQNIKATSNFHSTASTKGGDVEDLLYYLEVYMAVKDVLWGEYFRPRWTEQRLRTYGGKKRTFENFFWEIEKAGLDRGDYRPVAVAYGAAKFAPTGPGEIAVPTSRAYKECARRVLTIPTDEHLTTKRDYHTGEVLQLVRKRIRRPSRRHELTTEAQEKVRKYYRRRNSRRSCIIRGLLWCGSTKQAGRFVDRDENAALNIRRCLLETERPEALRRGQPRAVQEIIQSTRMFKNK